MKKKDREAMRKRDETAAEIHLYRTYFLEFLKIKGRILALESFLISKLATGPKESVLLARELRSVFDKKLQAALDLIRTKEPTLFAMLDLRSLEEF